MSEPFMEHPTSQFSNVLDAMTNAITRLRALPDWNDWITFRAQGMGYRLDSYAFFEVRLLGDQLDVGDTTFDTKHISIVAGLPPGSLTRAHSNYVASGLTPRQLAQLLDALFRHHGGIKPFPDEGDDYAVGAEW